MIIAARTGTVQGFLFIVSSEDFYFLEVRGEPECNLGKHKYDRQQDQDRDHERHRATEHLRIGYVWLNRLDDEQIEPNRRRDVRKLHVDDENDSKPHRIDLKRGQRWQQQWDENQNCRQRIQKITDNDQ